MTTTPNTHCVQCGREMEYYWSYRDKSFKVCYNPACPNYSLLQAGWLPKEEEK